ncbi:MAG TPA: hypothetical protein PLP29_15145 [Candidatus Ozemobacteraceae bacterium]|nr:hypothetical protein [Candidatus Ozemobacteraceae bacterium]
MNRLFLVFSLIVALSASAVPCSAETGSSSRLAGFDRQHIAEMRTDRGLPKQAWIDGTIGTTFFRLTLDRTLWTITGTAGNQPVELHIDHAARTIRGTAHGSGIDLAFDWSPERVGYEGTVYGNPYVTSTIWQDGTSTGEISCSPLALRFRLSDGTLTGTLGNRTASIRYDRVSGIVTGSLFGRPANLRLINLDFGDFIQHLYLFLR